MAHYFPAIRSRVHGATPTREAMTKTTRRRGLGTQSIPPGHHYFTDEVNLYRFVGWVGRPADAMLAALEDCRSLELVLVGADHLSRSALRPVLAPGGVAVS